MQVRMRIQFKSPTEEDWRTMRSLAASLTKQPESVRVSADSDPERLAAEFTMPTAAQYKALPKIESAIRHFGLIWNDPRFSFLYSEAERARAERSAERRKARCQAESSKSKSPPSQGR
jgi:hypothetical protein